MHTHGAGGADFMDGTVEAFLTAARMHAIHGTTLLCPTTLTSTNEILFESFETYKKAVKENKDGARFGGMHLEGPYFSPKFAGAQDPRYLRNPKPSEYMEILDRCPDLARWSFAPELDGSPEFAAELKRRGIVASIGHTDATFADCDAAYKAGAAMMTHFYSCMSTISRRNAYRYAGVIEYGYWQDGMRIEIIADGIHVPADLLHLLLKIKGVGNISLVTDSMRAAGMPEGKSVLGSLADGQEVIVEDTVANWTKYLCAELAIKFGEGIRVNAIAPGFLLTNQNRSLLTIEDGSLTDRSHKILAHTPIGRFLEPEELLGGLHYLASDASKAVTGTVNVVDGGFDAFSI